MGKLSAVVNFPDIKSAVDTVVTTLQCALSMARLELLDEVAVAACNKYSNLSLVETPVLQFLNILKKSIFILSAISDTFPRVPQHRIWTQASN